MCLLCSRTHAKSKTNRLLCLLGDHWERQTITKRTINAIGMTKAKTQVSWGHIIRNFNVDQGNWLEEVIFRLRIEDWVGVYQLKKMRVVNERAGLVRNRAFVLLVDVSVYIWVQSWITGDSKEAAKPCSCLPPSSRPIHVMLWLSSRRIFNKSLKTSLWRGTDYCCVLGAPNYLSW